MNLDAHERATLARLADVLIPAGEGFPAASAAGVAGAGLDQVLAVRPEVGPGLKQILSSAHGREAVEFMRTLAEHSPAAFELLTDVIPGAYFLNAEVRSMLGYNGQTPRPIEPQPDHLQDGLLQAVIDRGPIYRPTK